MLSVVKIRAANVRECLVSQLAKKEGKWLHMVGVVIDDQILALETYTKSSKKEY